MRTIVQAMVVAVGCAGLPGSADAAEIMGTELKDLISGKSIYLELTASATAGAGQGVIYYLPTGEALYKIASGATWHGTWTIKDNAVCNAWKEAPRNACTKYDRNDRSITLINTATGQARGKVSKIVAGNPERLIP